MIPKFKRLDPVSKSGGDYRFEGHVVGVIEKLSGEVRYAVEDDRGCLHIFNERQLIAREERTPATDFATDAEAISEAARHVQNAANVITFFAANIRNAAKDRTD